MQTFFRLFIALAGLFQPVFAQNSYFFPGKNLDPAISSPEAFLGYAIGSHHTRHDKMVEYMRYLDAQSDRVQVQKFGVTDEHREQVLVLVSNPANMARLEELRRQHLALSDPKQPTPAMENMPVVVWLGYNVHGNEPSGGEAAILTAYYLAASQDPELLDWLDKAIIILEPCLNPDGRDRHSQWANGHKATPNVADPNDREHNEVWPGGRFNHYWFDLNRDWYLLQQRESQNRLKVYHAWMPNVVTDHHEMGTNANFFFEPSKANAENDLVPPSVYRDLNTRFARYFEQAMNEIGALYGTRELFDNLYPGYGSSYPDMQGGLGLLFEQASARGHVQESRHGLLTFAFAVRNQLVNALATLRASVAERPLLLRHQRQFFKDAVDATPFKTYVVGDPYDAARNRAFVEMLFQHRIECKLLPTDYQDGNQRFRAGNAILISLNQPQRMLLRAMLETQTKGFKDSLFYDASTWNLPLAYGLPYAEFKGTVTDVPLLSPDMLGEPLPPLSRSSYAYVLEWTDYFAPRALQMLHEEGILTKVSSAAFSLKIAGKVRDFGHGSLVVPVHYQKMPPDSLFQKLRRISAATKVAVHAAETGLSETGPDLGTVSSFVAQKPQVLMVVGSGVTAPEAGEIWHLMDTRVGMPITKADISGLARLNLGRYNTIIMPGGNYQALDTVFAKKLKAWVALGNTLIAQKGAVEWVVKSKIFPSEKLREARPDTARYKPRVDFEHIQNVEGARQTGGAVFEADLDPTHPIGYGYTRRRIPLYRNNNTLLERSPNAANSVLVHTEKPLLSGYVHPQVLRRTANSAAINVVYEGLGRAVLFTFDPNFRATWYGTNKLFLNAVFFANGFAGQGG